MLQQEAHWLGDAIAKIDAQQMYPLLNLGSSTEEFRTKTQPWIDRWLFAPARSNGQRVVHMDLKAATGVDLTGDLNDARFLAEVTAMQFKSVLCTNLLEHVANPEQMCRHIESVVPPGGYIIVTCPYRYPYHPDPIDNGFRPTPPELALLFKRSVAIRSEIIECGTHLQRLIATPRVLRTLARLCLPIYRPAVWWRLFKFQAWLFMSFKVSGVILQRRDD